MSLMMIGIIIAVLVAAIVALMYFRPGAAQKRQQAAQNRRHKKKATRKNEETPHQEPSLGSTPFEAPHNDSVLGIQKEESHVAAAHDLSHSQTQLSGQYLVVNIIAPKGKTYSGYDLLQSLLTAGLRYGDMHIFHRHEEKTGRGDVLFSLAAMTKAGTFDLPRMGSFECSGLTLFLEPTRLKEPLKVLDLMLETAGELADELGGGVFDERRAKFTKETFVAMRTQLRKLTAPNQTSDMFVDA